jgi:hypothetical protein
MSSARRFGVFAHGAGVVGGGDPFGELVLDQPGRGGLLHGEVDAAVPGVFHGAGMHARDAQRRLRVHAADIGGQRQRRGGAHHQRAAGGR